MAPKKEEVVAVAREGKRIIIPEKMSYDDACRWIVWQRDSEEKVISYRYEFPCYPLDGVVALTRAIEAIYGYAEVQGGWFPPQMIQVPTSDGYVAAPFAVIKPPTWEGGHISPECGHSRQLTLSGNVKQKFQKEVTELVERTKLELRERSIYKAQALRVDLSWIDNGDFHPLTHAPKFIEGLKGVGEELIILNAETHFEVATNIYTLIEQSEACRKNSIPLRHGVLLAGTFGTGKTLLSRVIASKCPPNGWTFIYLEQVQHIAECLRLAEMYAPSVVFAEDIDRVLSAGRNERMNEILNTIDGMDTKGKPIITILTTNSPELIEPAFLRAGRMDTVIHMGNPDAEASQRFVQLYAKSTAGKSLLSEDCDLVAVGKELAGTSPAFIAESVHKAKRHAIYRTGHAVIDGKVTTEDLVLSGKAMQKHIKLAEQRVTKSDAELLVEATSRVGSALLNHD